MAGSAGTVREQSERNLRQVTGLLVRAFGERQVQVDCGGWPVVATLESIQLYEGGRDGARLSFRDVRWDGLLVERLTVEAEQAAITPPPTMTLNLSAITLRGRVTFAELVAWLDGAVARWQLRATPDYLIEATFHNGRWRVTFEPALLGGGEVQVALREVSWRCLRVRAPARFRVARTVQLPDLPAGISVSEAGRDNADVEFLLEVPPISRRLDLRQSLARVLASAGTGRATENRPR